MFMKIFFESQACVFRAAFKPPFTHLFIHAFIDLFLTFSAQQNVSPRLKESALRISSSTYMRYSKASYRNLSREWHSVMTIIYLAQIVTEW